MLAGTKFIHNCLRCCQFRVADHRCDGVSNSNAQQIVDCDADYVLALKANQGQLHEDVKLLFDGIADGRLPDVETDTAQTVDGDHGSRPEPLLAFPTLG